MTHCPGRNGVDGSGRHWQRNLDADLASIAAWGATWLVSLVESAEFERLGVAALPQKVQAQKLSWLHVPIRDMQAPQTATNHAWRAGQTDILDALARGESVVFHCAAGLGRTGTMVAAILIDNFGMDPDSAIALVRTQRPGTIESHVQETFLHQLKGAGLPKAAQ